MDDLVIRGGTVADGTGTPPRTADVAITAGRITAVGDNLPRGRRELDADGLLVSPGWADVHTHYDGHALWDPLLSPSSGHGVTTVVTGNCGVGIAPLRPADRDWTVALMEGVEDIPGGRAAPRTAVELGDVRAVPRRRRRHRPGRGRGHPGPALRGTRVRHGRARASTTRPRRPSRRSGGWARWSSTRSPPAPWASAPRGRLTTRPPTAA
ncbi:amidohydrolase family protein [Yinghuangia aomiensis]